MMKCGLRFFIVILSLCLLAGPAWSAVGKITGRVTEANDKPLPGVNVTVQGTRYGAVTDADGYYLILSVDVGAYDLKVSIMGYEAVREKNVEVFADRTTTRNFSLKETTVAGAEVVVQAQRPLVEVDRTGSETKISEKQIEQIPILRTVSDHLSYVAGVDPVRQGRNGIIIRREDNSRALQWQTWTLDGMELTLLDNGVANSIQLGYQYNNLPVTSIGEIAVVKGGQTASQATSASGVVNIVTREGSQDFHGGIDFRVEAPGKRHRGPNVYDATAGQRGGTNGIWRDNLKWNDPTWVNETDPVTGKQIHVKQDYTGAVGNFAEGWISGPLGQNATFVLSGKSSQAKQIFPAPSRVGLPQWSVFGKIAFTPTSNLKLKIGFNESREPSWAGDTRGANTNLFLVRDRGYTGLQRVWKNRVVYLTATHTINPKTFQEFQIGFYGSNVDTTADTDPTTSASFRRDKSGYFNLDRLNRTNLQIDRNRRYNIRYDFTSQITRWNLMKVGVTHQIFHNSNWLYQLSSPSSAGIWVIGEDSDPSKRYLAQRFAGYVDDKVEFQGFVMNAGLRYDVLWGGPEKPLAGFYKAMPGHRTYKAYLTRTPRRQMKPLATWSPRIGVSHPITARSAIRFSFGQYYKPSAFGDIFAEGWLQTNAQNNPYLNGAWADEPYAPGGGWYLDNAYRKPSGIANTTEFEVSGEWNFISDFVLDMATYYRRTERARGGQGRYFVDPVQGERQAWSQGPFARMESKGIEASLYKPLSRNFSFRLSMDVGWSFYYYTGGGPVITKFYPDSTYIASPNYFLVNSSDDPVPLTVAQIQDIGHRANEAIRKEQAAIKASQQVQDIQYQLRPFSEWEDMSEKDRSRPEVQGIWQTQIWRALKVLYDAPAPTTQASFQFLWHTPSNWGPGPKLGGSKLLGGIQANLVWRFYSGLTLSYTPPDQPNVKDAFRPGPMFVRADLNFQKAFEAGRVRPTVYAEVFNLFNSFVDETRSANYVRWGLKLPAPNDTNYLRYGDPTPFRGGTPRYVNLGVRFGF